MPIPLWVEEALDRWTGVSGIKDGCLFRAIIKSGKIWGEGMTPKVLWEVVKRAAQAAGIDSWHPAICDELVRVSVTWPAGSSTRSSFCSATSQYKVRSTTSAANKSSDSP